MVGNIALSPEPPPCLSLTDQTRASSPGEQHPAMVQWSAAQVRRRLYALLSQGWWERSSKGERKKQTLTHPNFQ